MIEILPTPAGVPTALLNGRLLHSSRDPVREASRAVREMVRREPPCVVLLGFGLGYHAEQLLAGTSTTNLVVFEPDPEVSRELAQARDVRAVVSSPRLSWCSSVADLEEALLTRGASGFSVLALPARVRSSPDAYARAELAIEAFRSRIEINANTLTRFGHLWVRNLLRNTGPLAKSVPVTELRNLFRDMPGILLAAGPSLDSILPVLPILAARAVVVAVDTAVSACLRTGVTPDIAVVVDPQYWNARHLDHVIPSGTLLVAESSTHPTVFRSFRAPPVMCGSMFPLGKHLESELGGTRSLGTGGSVSTTAWDLLRFMGCREVYVAGLDLGFPGGRTHFRGSFFEQLAIAQADRFHPSETTLFRYTHSADPHYDTATDGSAILTDRRMELYRSWFVRQVALPESPATRTLTPVGLAIPGIDVCEPARLQSLPVVRREIEMLVKGVAPREVSDADARMALIRTCLTDLREELNQMEALSSGALRIIEDVERKIAAGIQPNFTPLADIDAKIQSRAGRAVVSFLMQDAITRIRAGFGAASLAEQVEASRTLYAELQKSAAYHLDMLGTYVPDVN